MSVPVRAGSVRIARLDGDRWTPVGGIAGPVTFAPVLEQAAEHYAVAMDLTRDATITVAFRPSRQMVRLLFGWSATVDRSAVRAATRRRYLARRRSR